MTLPTPARAARLAAGLTLADAARRARVSPNYLRSAERQGLSEPLLRRLARAYGCRMDALLLVSMEGGMAGYSSPRTTKAKARP